MHTATWFQEAQVNNHRAAVEAIVSHYEGVGEVNKKVSAAEVILKLLYYKKEGVFSMEKFVTKLKECFTDLEDSNKGYTDQKKVFVQTIRRSIRSKLLSMLHILATLLRPLICC
jgi:hypothetical protein